MSTPTSSSTQQPLTSGSCSELNSTDCVICGKNEKLLRCSRCKTISYCSKEHQKLDWKNHKKNCKKLIQQHKQEPSQSLRNTKPLKKKGSALGEVDCNKPEKSKISKSHRININDNLHPKKLEEGRKSPITSEGSSEDIILKAGAELLNPLKGSTVSEITDINKTSNMPERPQAIKKFPEVCLKKPGKDFASSPSFENELDKKEFIGICERVIADMNKYGMCIINNFLGGEKSLKVLSEVLNIYNTGVFRDGQLVSNKAGATNTKTIRGDQITWLNGKEKNCEYIGMLIQKVDSIITVANIMANNGKLGDHTIHGRTKAMVSCYPGEGAQYVKHVDNPNKDGRCITSIYYLNKDWDVKTMGGLLRIFPSAWEDQIAEIEPILDRLIFFWSDRRNPHEVQKAYKTRYAITLWYFDKDERMEACRRYQRDKETNEESENS